MSMRGREHFPAQTHHTHTPPLTLQVVVVAVTVHELRQRLARRQRHWRRSGRINQQVRAKGWRQRRCRGWRLLLLLLWERRLLRSAGRTCCCCACRTRCCTCHSLLLRRQHLLLRQLHLLLQQLQPRQALLGRQLRRRWRRLLRHNDHVAIIILVTTVQNLDHFHIRCGRAWGLLLLLLLGEGLRGTLPLLHRLRTLQPGRVRPRGILQRRHRLLGQGGCCCRVLLQRNCQRARRHGLPARHLLLLLHGLQCRDGVRRCVCHAQRQ